MRLKAKTIATQSVMQSIASVLAKFEPIELAQAIQVKLMKRTETKFLVNVSDLYKLLNSISDKFRIQTIGTARSQEYRTMYLDTASLSMYVAHCNKHSLRQKIRLRTYALTNETYFEVKTNTNGNTNKQRIQVLNGSLWSRNEAVSQFLVGVSDYNVGQLQPSVVSEFNRVTLVGINNTERLTIDTEIRMQNVRTGLSFVLPNIAVVELKCDGKPLDFTAEMVKHAHLEQSSFSKYCVGIALTNVNAEKRGFEQQLFLLEKLSDM